MKILLLLFLILPAAILAKRTYLVAVPRIIYHDSPSTAVVTISSLPADATITITLEQKRKNRGTFSKVVSSSTTSQIVHVPFTLNDVATGNIKFNIKSEGGLQFSHSTNLQVEHRAHGLFIQTDKPMYKPGGKIRFRVVGVDKDLKPFDAETKLDEIYIQNPAGSRMIQWTNKSLDLGMASFELPLSVKPVLGKWKILVKPENGLVVQKTIEVEKYVLPKFQVDVTSEPYILYDAKETTIKICGRYTYGKKVRGKLEVKVCPKRKHRYYRDMFSSMCMSFNQKIDGCAEISYPFKMLNKRRQYHQYSSRFVHLQVEATITEEGTNKKQNTTHNTVKFSPKKVVLKFDSPKSYKPGFPYKVKLTASTPDGRPLQENIKVEFDIRKIRNNQRSLLAAKFTETVRNGVYEFVVTPESGTHRYHYNANYKVKSKSGYQTTGQSSAWYSPTDRYVKINNIENLKVGDTAKVNVMFSSNSLGEKAVHYMLVCRGITTEASTRKVRSLSTYLSFKVREEMLPLCRLLVYYFHGNEFVSDSLVINFQISFKNKVSLAFDDDEKKPGEEIELIMKASPGSKFAVSAVDQSVLLLGKRNEIEENEVMSILSKQDVTPSYSSRSKCHRRRWYRSYMPYYPIDDRVDGKEALRNTGVVYFSNADIDVVPCTDKWWGHGEVMIDSPIMEMMPAASIPKFRSKNVEKKMRSDEEHSSTAPTKKPKTKAKEEPSLRIRKEFPETWLWTDEYISSTGEKRIKLKVPDAMTTWHATGFAISSNDGIGVSKPTTLKAFQPFFISLNLPYSVKRDEIVKIPATVFNYLQQCLVIGVSMAMSSDFTAVTGITKKICVCGNDGKTVSFGIKPKKLGKIDITVHARSYGASTNDCGKNTVPVTSVLAVDALTKKLLVEAEGIKKEYSKSLFFCPNDHENGAFKDKVSLHLPKKIVSGSVYSELNIVGDLLGPSMSGLDKLLAMPYGCGEQNMLKFAPNVYIMDYLRATSQSDKTIEAKAIKYMMSGYQRELTYKHKNGGYSAFGESSWSRQEASTWLTAFVLRTYAQARRYIYIDPKEIEASRNWLLSLQNQNTGCFKELGMIHHKEMKGGVTGGITMTAFVVISLLEADVPYNDDRIQSAVRCVVDKVDDVSDPYTTIILAFALKMAGSSEAQRVIEKIDKMAIREDGMHWEKGATKKQTNEYKYYHAARSVDIEMTAYALMTYIGGRKQSGSKLDHLSIVKWISKQRNPEGGFTSTQDTCVGLQALSQYAASSYSSEIDMNIKATQSTPPYDQHDIKINNNNKLVLQKYVLNASLPTDINIEATGKGCALVQANVKYNEPEPGTADSFDLSYTIKQDKDSMTCEHTMKVCGRFTGKGKSNMALIDVNMVSGFQPIMHDLDMLLQTKTDNQLTQYEFDDDVLTFYFNEITDKSSCVEFAIEQNQEVQDRKPASVKIYDYYDKDNEATKMYSVGICPETNIVS